MISAASRTLLCVSVTPVPTALRAALEGSGWKLLWFSELRVAARAITPGAYQIGMLIVDEIMPAHYNQLEAIFKADRSCEWVGVFSPAAQQAPGCIELILGYLFDHHTMPVDTAHLMQTLGHALGRAQLQRHAEPGCAPPFDATPRILGQSAAIKTLMLQLRKVAATDAPVLIGGESGSGKELAAQAVHQLSSRRAGPFIAVNCGAIAGSLIQAELFGAVRGAYTGATRDRKGFIESADGGTIFLDEIADLPLEMQINLLRFLQEQTITPVGSGTTVRVNARVVAATNVELERAVEEGRFRQDLYYRLNVLALRVPPLRERREDIAILAQHFFSIHPGERHRRLRGFSQSALRAMMAYDWPGNVRELINRVRRAMVMSEGRLITPVDLGLATEVATASDRLGHVRVDAERAAVCRALAHADNNVTHAARELGVSRMTLYRLIERHQIDSVARRSDMLAVPKATSEPLA
jgi:two-component system response regulator HydG